MCKLIRESPTFRASSAARRPRPMRRCRGASYRTEAFPRGGRMRITNSARVAVACLVAGALACAGNTARVDDETAAAAQDTTTTETPPGYSGMERDTTMAPDSAPTAVDTFLEQQGTGVPADTQGYGGFEQPDTTGGAGEAGQDTSGHGKQPGQTG